MFYISGHELEKGAGSHTQSRTNIRNLSWTLCLKTEQWCKTPLPGSRRLTMGTQQIESVDYRKLVPIATDSSGRRARLIG